MTRPVKRSAPTAEIELRSVTPEADAVTTRPTRLSNKGHWHSSGHHIRSPCVAHSPRSLSHPATPHPPGTLRHVASSCDGPDVIKRHIEVITVGRPKPATCRGSNEEGRACDRSIETEGSVSVLWRQKGECSVLWRERRGSVSVLWRQKGVCLSYGDRRECVCPMETEGSVSVLWRQKGVCLSYGDRRECVCPMETEGSVSVLWRQKGVCLSYGDRRECVCPMKTEGSVSVL